MRERGLTSIEATDALKRFGYNTLESKKRFSPILLLIDKFKSPLSLLLIGTAIVAYFLGEKSNSLIVILMVTISALVDFVNTYHSEKAIKSLEAKVATKVTIIRDGKTREIAHALIVPGDVVILEAGDVIPADMWLSEAKDFHLNEAALTGESFPVQKSAALKAPIEVSIHDASSALMGTSVISGYGVGHVIATGCNTQYGKVAESLQAKTSQTEFERGVSTFSYLILKITILLVITVFVVNAYFGRGILESLLFAIAIAIGLTPELLPVILSVSMARGSMEMAKKNVIVKKLIAIQNLGGMNVLCTDKTGTLTENKIILVKWLNLENSSDEHVLETAFYSSAFQSGVRNPLDEAIGRAKTFSLKNITKIDEIPFDFERKRNSVVIKKGREQTLITKGAPDVMLKCISHIKVNGEVNPFNTEERKRFIALYNNLNQDGYRVLALATKNVTGSRLFETKDENNLTAVGLIAFLDPPKEGAGAAIESLGNLGVEVKVITGDHEILAEKICREVGLKIAGVVTGQQLARLQPHDFKEMVLKVNVFARVLPEQKELIVKTLREAGKVVGFLGDGINDAPALRMADVGISVDNAVAVAKEEADIILLRKSLMVLHDGIVEGRKTFRNTIKYVLTGLSSNFGDVFTMAGASFFLPFLPMLPAQALLNNFLYDMSQLSISSDNVDQEELSKPLNWNFNQIYSYMIVFGGVTCVFDIATYVLLLKVFNLNVGQFQTSWFIESLLAQAVVVLVIRTKKVPFLQSWPSTALLLNVAIIVLIAWILPFASVGSYFGFTPLPTNIFLALNITVVAYLFVANYVKGLFYKFAKNNSDKSIF